MGELILVRHGQTAWSESGRHTGVTDVPLTADGEARARRVGAVLRSRRPPALALVSPLIRARHTAELAGFPAAEVEPNLAEFDYGGYEGRTTAEISNGVGHPWLLWTDGVVPGATPGETVDDVAKRAEAVLDRARPALPDGDVVLFSHGHLLRILAARWLGLPPADGRLLALSAGAVSVLGTEHDLPVISLWNSVPPPEPPPAGSPPDGPAG